MRVFKSIVKAASFLAVCLVCMTFVSAASGEPMDIVVLFDMSRGGSGEPAESGGPVESYSSLAHFEETRGYITGAFLKEFLRKGDTFHLISFGDTPRIELSRRIEGEGDYRTIIGRLLLLYPLARSSSLENAAAYAQAFVAELPPARQKKVVFFTAQGGVTATELGARFNSKNTTFYLASIPASFGTLVSGRAMMKAPPKITPPVIAARPPVAPPVAAPPVSDDVEPPVIELLPDITAIPTPPESRLLWDSRDEPVLFDRFKALMIILPLAGMILLLVLGLGCVVTWEKRDPADTYTIEDYLYQMNGNPAPRNAEGGIRYVIPGCGLLQKASEVKEQLA